MTLKELREKHMALAKQLEPFAGRALEAEEASQADTILAEFNTIGEQIVRAENTANALKEAEKYTKPAGERASGVTERQDGASRLTVEQVSPLRRFVDSDEYRAALSDKKGVSNAVEVGSFHERGSLLRWDAENGALSADEVRAVLHSGTASGSMLLPQVLPTIYRAGEAPLVMRDVLVNASTDSDTITVLQESGFTNSAAEVAEATATNGAGLTGGVKPESALTFSEVSYPVRWIAHWMPITRQMLEDLPAMRSYVEERLVTGIKRREDNELLNGNGTAPNISGILNDGGIQVLDGTYFTGAAVKGVGTARENFDRILRAKRLIRDTGRAQATFVVVNPVNYEAMVSLADANGLYYAGGPFNASGVPTLWGLPVVESENIAANTALVGDGMMAAVFDRHDARIYTTDSHSDFFVRNLLVILAEERLALAIFRPAAFAKVTLVP